MLYIRSELSMSMPSRSSSSSEYSRRHLAMGEPFRQTLELTRAGALDVGESVVVSGARDVVLPALAR